MNLIIDTPLRAYYLKGWNMACGIETTIPETYYVQASNGKTKIRRVADTYEEATQQVLDELEKLEKQQAA